MPELPAEGWYPDPTDPAMQRWWNGEAWTRDTHRTSPASETRGRPATARTNPIAQTRWSRRQWLHVIVAVATPVIGVVALIAFVINTSSHSARAVPAPENDEIDPAPATTSSVEVATTAPETTTTTSLPATTTPTPDPTSVRYEAGTHAVGEDIAPGTYRVTMHWARLDENLDVIDNDLTISGLSIMTVLASDAFVELSGTAVRLSSVPELDPIDNGFDQGTYLVGADLAPGTYEILARPEATAFVARLTDDLSVIETHQDANRVVVVVAATDFALRYTGTLSRVD